MLPNLYSSQNLWSSYKLFNAMAARPQHNHSLPQRVYYLLFVSLFLHPYRMQNLYAEHIHLQVQHLVVKTEKTWKGAK